MSASAKKSRPTALLLILITVAFALSETATAQRIHRIYSRGGPADDETPPPPPLDDITLPVKPVEQPSPSLHFGKSVLLPTVLGDGKLPYTGFRGCVPFVCASLLHAYGHPLEEHIVAQLEALDPEKDGTPRSKTLLFLRRFFTVEARDEVSPAELISHIDGGLPLYVRIVDGEMHAALVTGYKQSPNSEILTLILTDNGASGGELTDDRFLELWDTPRSKKSAIFVRPKGPHAPSALRFEQELAIPSIAPPPHANIPSYLTLYVSLFAATGCTLSSHAVHQLRLELDSEDDGITGHQFSGYLEKFFDIERCHNTSPSHLLERLQAGFPTIVFLRLARDVPHTTGHYYIVSGSRLDQFGNPLSWTVVAQDTTRLSHAELLAAWDTPTAKNYSISVSRNHNKPAPTFEQHAESSLERSTPRTAARARLPVKRFDASCLSANRSSAPLALASFFFALGHELSEPEIRGLAFQIDPENDGTTLREIHSFLASHLSVPYPGQVLPRELKSSLDAGRPVLVPIRTGHNAEIAVLLGYETDHKGEFVSWDYAVHTTFYPSIPHREFLSRWRRATPNEYAALTFTDDISSPRFASALDSLIDEAGASDTEYTITRYDLGLDAERFIPGFPPDTVGQSAPDQDDSFPKHLGRARNTAASMLRQLKERVLHETATTLAKRHSESYNLFEQFRVEARQRQQRLRTQLRPYSHLLFLCTVSVMAIGVYRAVHARRPGRGQTST